MAIALHRRRVGRHDDDARDVEHLSGERDRLRVVAGREGDDAAAALVGGEARERVVGAAELEGAGALQVLALEEQVGAGARVDGARGRDRRPWATPAICARGALDVGERWQDEVGEPVPTRSFQLAARALRRPCEWRSAPAMCERPRTVFAPVRLLDRLVHRHAGLVAGASLRRSPPRSALWYARISSCDTAPVSVKPWPAM